MRVLFFILGAGIGAPLRYVIDKFFRSRVTFPFGILLVNFLGSLLLGYTQLNFFLMGFCGAFTTWSAFMLDVENPEITKAAKVVNVALTFLLSIAGIYLGFALAS